MRRENSTTITSLRPKILDAVVPGLFMPYNNHCTWHDYPLDSW